MGHSDPAGVLERAVEGGIGEVDVGQAWGPAEDHDGVVDGEGDAVEAA